MKFQLEEDRKRRNLFAFFEKKRRGFKALSVDVRLPIKVRLLALSKLRSLPRNRSICRVRNRCVYSGRSRAVIRFFRMSRVALRYRALRGYIPGLFKASWLVSCGLFRLLWWNW